MYQRNIPSRSPSSYSFSRSFIHQQQEMMPYHYHQLQQQYGGMLVGDGSVHAQLQQLHQQRQAREEGTSLSITMSNDFKPRIRWTQELHAHFVAAVNQLGGPFKATPKALMSAMNINGLTLHHLKSHLQKYRMGRPVGRLSGAQKSYQRKRASPEVAGTSSEPSEIKNNVGALKAFKGNYGKPQLQVEARIEKPQSAEERYLEMALENARRMLSDQNKRRASAHSSRPTLQDFDKNSLQHYAPSCFLDEMSKYHSHFPAETSKVHNGAAEEIDVSQLISRFEDYQSSFEPSTSFPLKQI